MRALVQGFQSLEVARGLSENSKLLEFQDERGRNWLHLCCSVKFKLHRLKAADSIKTAEVLLKAGIDINKEAFREENFRATPLWFTVAHGQNLALAEYLLERGSDPNHCLFAAGYNNDIEAIKLLARYGAEIDPSVEDASPFLAAIQWSRFAAAEQLLNLGADIDFQDSKKMTALHYMLRKGSEKKHIQMLIRHGARGDIRNAGGATAAEILMRKRDTEFRKMADKLQTRG